MDFEHANKVGSVRCCIAAMLGTLVLSGCSSSEGYVDYADIPGPKVVASDGLPHEDSPSSDSVDEDVSAKTRRDDQAATDVVEGTSSAATNDVKPNNPPGENQAGHKGDPPTDDGPTENPAAGQSNTVPSQEDTLVAVETESDTSEMPAEPREIKLLIPEKTFRKIPESDCLSVTYDDIDLLKILNMEPVPADAPDHFPEWLRQLDGKRIRLRGFMFPAFVPTGIKTFGFARDNGICCFVKQPKVYDMIEVRMAEGKTTDYIDGRPFDVEGTFRIDPYVDDAELLELYRIEDATVLN